MRPDGKKLKHIDPMNRFIPYMMPKRYDAMNMITVDLPYEPMQEYIKEKRKEGVVISHMALFIAAYLRTCAKFPALNRFVVNKKMYARNEYAVAMVVLTPGTVGGGTEAKVYFEPTDTIFDVNNKINDFIKANRDTPENNGMEKFMKIMLKIPGLLKFGAGVLKCLDKYGLVPKSLIDVSPFHASMVLSNLISIRTNHIYHHAYDFGTTGLVVTMGNLREVPKRKGKEIVFERSLPLGIVMDERICSGYYFAQSIRYMKKFIKDPVLLETPPDEVVKDPWL